MALSHISLKSAWRLKHITGKCQEKHFNCTNFNLVILSKEKKIYSQLQLSVCTDNNPHLKFCNCVVLIVCNLVLHGAEVHGMFDNCWVTRGNCICYWKREKSMGIFPGKTRNAPSVQLYTNTTESASTPQKNSLYQNLMSVLLSHY